MTNTELKIAPKDYIFMNKVNAEETKIYNILTGMLNISRVSVKIKATELLAQLGKEPTKKNISDLSETLFKMMRLFAFYNMDDKGNFRLINVIQELSVNDNDIFVWFSEAFLEKTIKISQ